MIIWHFYVIIVIEISSRVTTARIVIINIEKKNEMISKKSVEIKRFIKEYDVLSLYYAHFIMDAHGC